MKFITVKPDKFHPHLVSKFFKRAEVVTDGKSFNTNVYDTRFSISAKFLAEEFELSQSGTSIFTFKENSSNAERNHLNK